MLGSQHPNPRQKRRFVADGGDVLSLKRTKIDDSHVPNQRLKSENIFPIGSTRKPRTAISTRSAFFEPCSASVSNCQISVTDENALASPHQKAPHHVIRNTTVHNASSTSTCTTRQDAMAVSPIKILVKPHMFDCTINGYDADDLTQFDSSSPQFQVGNLTFDDDDDDSFNTDISNDDLLMLNFNTSGTSLDADNENLVLPAKPIMTDLDNKSHCPGSSEDNLIVLTEDASAGVSECLLKTFISPVVSMPRLLAANIDDQSMDARKPIVRPAFPTPVRDRSPIIGLSSMTLLKTCFRIGEAINQGCQAARSGQRVVIELNARVLYSRRTDTKQYFTFCDLFHTKAPYINAVYDAAIWKSVQLFEYDGRDLLQTGKICRCIGTMKRDGKEWIMAVLNIWEASWDDIRWVEGIVSRKEKECMQEKT